MRTSRRHARGSALAMLLLIAAGLIGAFLIFGKGFVAERKLEAGSTHQRTFAVINEALLQFALLNKRLPCPASGSAANGAEHVLSDTTDCQSPAGTMPWSTLGLPEAAAIDAHGRMLGYRVFDGPTGFTRSGGLNLHDCLDEDDAVVVALAAGGVCNATTHENTRSDFFEGKGLTVDDRGVSTSKVAYLLMSHGPSGFGAHLPSSSSGAAMASPASGSKEAINASDSLTYWMLDPNTNVDPGHTDHFDDFIFHVNVNDLVVGAKLAGRPWPIAARLDATNLGIVALNNHYWSTSIYPTVATAAVTAGSAMKISVGPESERTICTVTSTPEAIAPCYFLSTDGSDPLSTANGERLVFTFRVKRRHLIVKLADFRTASSNAERARFTFFNGSTQVHDVVKDACVGGSGATATFLIDPTAEFTKVEIRANDSSTTTNFAVSSVSACRYSDSNHCYLHSTDVGGTVCP